MISGLLATSTTTEPKHIAKEIYGFPKDARKVTFALEVSESAVNHGELVVFFGRGYRRTLLHKPSILWNYNIG